MVLVRIIRKARVKAVFRSEWVIDIGRVAFGPVQKNVGKVTIVEGCVPETGDTEVKRQAGLGWLPERKDAKQSRDIAAYQLVILRIIKRGLQSDRKINISD